GLVADADPRHPAGRGVPRGRRARRPGRGHLLHPPLRPDRDQAGLRVPERLGPLRDARPDPPAQQRVVRPVDPVRRGRPGHRQGTAGRVHRRLHRGGGRRGLPAAPVLDRLPRQPRCHQAQPGRDDPLGLTARRRRLSTGPGRPHPRSARAASIARWNVGYAYIIERSVASGTSACTATVSALSTSPPDGPADVAPTSTSRSASATSLMKPSLPALWIQPRAEVIRSVYPVRTGTPRSRALASVSPTAPISGSVNVTRGSARWSAAGPPCPRMSRTTMSAWYIATWVNAPLPVTSPTPHSRSPARNHSSTSRNRASSGSPTLDRPSSPRSARRPVATSSRCATRRCPSS